jgi:NADP-dependent aldehyde dehydrogenase
MGSCNPVVVLPEDIKDSGVDWSVQLANSITQGSGQFCTKPGLIFTIDTPATEEFITVLTRQIMASEEHVMLHTQIAEKYKHNLQEIHDAGIELSTSSNTLSQTGTIAISRCTGTAFLTNPTLQREIFGPFALLISCISYAELERCLLSLRGQLTASIFCSESELLEQAVLVDALRKIAGRVIFNGVPTGVTVCPSMHHGGPYPAATDSRFTSVGIDAICRFSRPQVFQNWPDNALPDALKNKNPDRINRRVDGKWTFTEIV